MSASSLLLVDSDVLITAKDRYYGFDLCPGFWSWLVRQHTAGRVGSIDRIRSELLNGHPSDPLFQWVKNEAPAELFRPVDGMTQAKFADVITWVQKNPQFLDSAKSKFASGADGWLVAFAAVHGATVVTNERSAPLSKKEIKIPDVCNAFDVPWIDTFAMLRAVGACFIDDPL
jgi:hypothetical protein